MKGYIPIEIPTKAYIRAYVMAELIQQSIMNTEHRIGIKLYGMLNHQLNERRTEFAKKRHNIRLRVYVNYHTFHQQGPS